MKEDPKKKAGMSQREDVQRYLKRLNAKPATDMVGKTFVMPFKVPQPKKEA
jgi:hypothetical protein